MKSLLVINIGLAATWYFTDIQSDNFVYNVLCPTGVFVFLVSLLLWLVLKAGFSRKIDTVSGFVSSDTIDGGGSGDGGC